MTTLNRSLGLTNPDQLPIEIRQSPWGLRLQKIRRRNGDVIRLYGDDSQASQNDSVQFLHPHTGMYRIFFNTGQPLHYNHWRLDTDTNLKGIFYVIIHQFPIGERQTMDVAVLNPLKNNDIDQNDMLTVETDLFFS